MKRLFNFIQSLFCRHKNLTFKRNIHGDEIIQFGYERSIWVCGKCKGVVFKPDYREHAVPGVTRYDE